MGISASLKQSLWVNCLVYARVDEMHVVQPETSTKGEEENKQKT